MLQDILKRQADFQKNFYDVESMSLEERTKWTKEFILCLHQELAEVLNSLDWKSYHMYDKNYDHENTKEEIIDCFKFVLNLAIVWRIDSEELIQLFNKKSDLVEERLKIK